MPRHVVAIVGENANGILRCQSERFGALLQSDDVQCHVLDVCQPGFLERLLPLMAQDVAFAWGYAGIGSRLAIDGGNFWEATKTPFISVLADPPYIMPGNHRVQSRYVVNAYVYDDWLQVQERCFHAPQINACVSLGVLSNPARGDIPWRQRANRAVLVKGGGDAAGQRARWARWPAITRAVLNDSADALCAMGTAAILPTVLDCLRSHRVLLDGRPDLLFGLLAELDTFMRNHRATMMVRALRPLPVTIVGGGWDHLSGEPGRAKFRPPIDASHLETLYADTQVLLNSNPNQSTGLHERVLRGFAAGCRVISDDNAFSRTALAAIPSYTGVEWNDSALTDRFAAALADMAEPDTQPADAYVAANNDPGVFLRRLVCLAELARSGEHMLPFMMDAA